MRGRESCALLDDLEDGWTLTPGVEAALVALGKKLGIRVANTLLKTWVNGWTTSTRMHEEISLRCVFGCCEDDSISHYLCCDILWTVVIGCTYPRQSLLHVSPSERVCLSAPCELWAKLITVAASCYHSIKLGYKDEVELALYSDDFSHVQNRLIDLAVAFAKEVL